jgi:hypothetical protein
MPRRNDLTEREIRRNADAKALWQNADTNGLQQQDIADRFGMSVGWLQGLARREKWGAWPKSRQQAFGVPRAIDYRLYHELAADIAVVRDFGGQHVAKFRDGFRVGLDVLNGDQVRRRAAELRARRQASPAAGQAASPSQQPKGQEHGETQRKEAAGGRAC